MLKTIKVMLVVIGFILIFGIQASAGKKTAYQVEVVLDTNYCSMVYDDKYIFALSEVDEIGIANRYKICDSCYSEDMDCTSGFAYAIYDKDMNMLCPPINQIDCLPVWENETKFFESVLKIKRDNKYGYLNSDAALIIPAIYEEAYDFCDDIAKVKKDGQWGVIDKTGETVIDYLYSYIGKFSDGKAVAQKDDVMGVLDINGDFLELSYNYLSEINNGYIFACMDTVMGHSWGDEINLWSYWPKKTIEDNFGFIDVAGNVICPFTLGARQVICELIHKDDELYIINSCYFKASAFNDDGYAVIMQNDKYGFMDKNGRIQNGLPFDSISGWAFSTGYFTDQGVAFVQMGEKCGIVNSTGELLAEYRLDEFSYYNSDSDIFANSVEDQVIYQYLNGMYQEPPDTYKYLFDNYCIAITEDVKNNRFYESVESLDGDVILESSYLEVYGYNGKNVLAYHPGRKDYELFNAATGATICRGQIYPFSEERLFISRDGLNYLADWDGKIINEVYWDYNFSINDFYKNNGFGKYDIVNVKSEYNEKNVQDEYPAEYTSDGNNILAGLYDIAYDYQSDWDYDDDFWSDWDYDDDYSDIYSYKYGVVDKYGNILIEPVYSFVEELNRFDGEGDLSIWTANNYDDDGDINDIKLASTTPENKRKAEYFDGEGNLIFFCARGKTYTADNIKICDVETKPVFSFVNENNYIIVIEVVDGSLMGAIKVIKNNNGGKRQVDR